MENVSFKKLLKIIYYHVEPGTLIVSDSWSSYNKIKELKDFDHITVNHSIQLIDPESGAHTQKIEGLWGKANKKNLKI